MKLQLLRHFVLFSQCWVCSSAGSIRGGNADSHINRVHIDNGIYDIDTNNGSRDFDVIDAAADADDSNHAEEEGRRLTGPQNYRTDDGDDRHEKDRLELFGGETRIIGGSKAPSGSFSYIVSLSDDLGHFCGGALIARDMVLSAAHCSGGKYDVVVGRTDLNSRGGEVIAQSREEVHPKYNWKSTSNDFLIIYLASAVQDSNIAIVQLNGDGNVPSVGDGVTVAGWGDTRAQDKQKSQASQKGLSDVLMNVEVNVISNQDCDQSKGTIDGTEESYEGQITSSMLCAQDNGQDACQGDSGGPLVVRGGKSDGSEDVQVGVVSWGVGCAHPDFPGVYSRVSEAYSWIKAEVCGEGNGPGSSDKPEYLCGGKSGADTGSDSDSGSDSGSGSGGEGGEGGGGGGGGGGNWKTLVTEDFTGGMGFFHRGGRYASYYPKTKNRVGVVRIQNGRGRKYAIMSDSIQLDKNYSKIRAVFSMYGLGMEEDDEFCMECSDDGGSNFVTARCWNSRDDFQNKVWYDGISAECDVQNADSVVVMFRCAGNQKHDDVLFSDIEIQGELVRKSKGSKGKQ